MKRRYGNMNPRIIEAKFDSVCAETGKPIKKGEECLYYPNGKSVFRLDTKQAADWRSQQFDEHVLGYVY